MRVRFTLFEGFDRIYHPLRFRAFWNNHGYCYLRVKIANGKIIFTCAQLRNYHNTSITNAVESVRVAAIDALMRDGALKVSNQQTFFDLFKSDERKIGEFDAWVFDYVDRNSEWVEYYHPEDSITDNERYTIVRFSGGEEPDWFPTSQRALEQEYPGLDFSVDENLLLNWVGEKLSTSDIKNLLREKNWTMKEVAE